MPTESEKTVNDYRLARYIVLLILDMERLDDYVGCSHEDRKTEMRSAGLNDEEIDLLTTGCFVNLCRYLKEPGTAPVADEDTGGGPGSG